MALGGPNIATAGVRIVPDFSGFTRSLKTALTANLSGVSQAVVATAGAAATAITGIAIAGARDFAQFETTIAKINGLVGVSREELAGMTDELKNISSATAQGPQELAEAMFFVTSAGLRGAEAMEVLDASAKAATAGLGETATIADAVTSVLNAYTPEVISAEEATDVLVATVREGKVEADTLAGVVGRIIPLASTLGVSFQDLGGAIAAMTRVGLDANESGTALRGLLSTLAKPTTQAEDALNSMGTSLEELRFNLDEGGILQLLRFLSERFEGNEDALAQVIPNIRALTGALAIISQDAGTVDGIFARVADSTGALGNAFDAVASTDAFKFQEAMNQVKLLLLEAGQRTLPAFAAALEDLVPVFTNTIVPAVLAGIDVFVLFVEGVRSVIESLFDIVDNVPDVVKALGAILLALNALYASPVLAGLAAVVAAVVAIGGDAKETKKDIEFLADQLERMGEVDMEGVLEAVGDENLNDLKEVGLTLEDILHQTELGRDAWIDWWQEFDFAAGTTSDDLDEAREALMEFNEEYRNAIQIREQQADTDRLLGLSALYSSQQQARQTRALRDTQTEMDKLNRFSDIYLSRQGAFINLSSRFVTAFDQQEQALRDAEAAGRDLEASYKAVFGAQLALISPAVALLQANQKVTKSTERLNELREDSLTTDAELAAGLTDVALAVAEVDALTGDFAVNLEGSSQALIRTLVEDVGAIPEELQIVFDQIFNKPGENELAGGQAYDAYGQFLIDSFASGIQDPESIVRAQNALENVIAQMIAHQTGGIVIPVSLEATQNRLFAGGIPDTGGPRGDPNLQITNEVQIFNDNTTSEEAIDNLLRDSAVAGTLGYGPAVD